MLAEWVFRVVFLLPVVYLWGANTLLLLPGPWQETKTAEGTICPQAYALPTFMGIFYGAVYFFLLCALYYACRFGLWSTLIPFISTSRYKVLVALSFVSPVPVLVVAAVGTRRMPCGPYTLAGKEEDGALCDAWLH